ncbi:MAG: tyrosine-type recombinase/integrase [Thermodesulfobacteriota bacterium]
MSRRIPQVLTAAEQRRLLARFDPNDFYELRNLCLVRLMLNAGLRASEALGVKVQDLNWQTGKLRVRGKGKKERIVWIRMKRKKGRNNGLADGEVLRLWRDRFWQDLPVEDLLFPTRQGRSLSDRYLRKVVKEAGLKAGIATEVHPHLLRHTFATDLLRKTRNLRLTQKALGHSQITSTQIYTHIVDDELEEALKTLRD